MLMTPISYLQTLKNLSFFSSKDLLLCHFLSFPKDALIPAIIIQCSTVCSYSDDFNSMFCKVVKIKESCPPGEMKVRVSLEQQRGQFFLRDLFKKRFIFGLG